MLKKELRKSTRKVLSKIPITDIESQSIGISKQAALAVKTKFPINPPRGVSLFLNKADSEVQTKTLIDMFRAQGVAVYVPFISGRQTMDLLEIFPEEDISRFPVDRWHLPVLTHVEKRTKASPEDVDIVFFPGVAFQLSNGNRLGQGMGFYDIFVTALDAQRVKLGLPPVWKLALALNQMIVEHVPVDKHDVCMDGIVTSERVVYPKKH